MWVVTPLIAPGYRNDRTTQGLGTDERLTPVTLC